MDLATYLSAIGDGDATREVASWRLDEVAWRRIVVEPYRALHADYASAFDAAAPELVARLQQHGTIAIHPHFAGQPLLTMGQARARWALPVAFGSQVATIGNAPLDAVFVHTGDRWRVIVGVDVMIRARVAVLDPECAKLLDLPAPRKPCRDIAWEIAEAALRADSARFDHSCTLATKLCR